MYKNYTIVKEKYIPMIRSKALILKHDKTGANIELFINDDKHYACSISFRCPTIDSSGVKHIIEHSALCGSRKYPIKEPFLELKKTSAYTYLNAITTGNSIEFPFSSANMKDFRNIMDIYLDAAFYPNFLTNKNIFLREGWRYEYDEEKDALSYNGIVYNEMLGSFSDSNLVLDYNVDQKVFYNNYRRFTSGGFPDDIVKLSYEDFITYYNKYIHPSNCYIGIYGNVDYEEILEYLDKEYLSKYDKIEIEDEKDVFDTKKELIEYTVDFPIDPEETEEDMGCVGYRMILPLVEDVYHQRNIKHIMHLITSDRLNTLSSELNSAGICKGLSYDLSFDKGLSYVTFYADRANLDRKYDFLEAIDNAIKKIHENGVDRKTMEGFINPLEITARKFGGDNIGLASIDNSFSYWLRGDDPFIGLDIDEIIKEERKCLEGDYLEQLIEKYFLNCTGKILVTCIPSKSYQQEHAKKNEEALINFKNSLTKEELLKIIDEEKAFIDYEKKEDNPVDIEKIPHLTRNDIVYDGFKPRNIEKVVNGIKVIGHDYFTNEVVRVVFRFNVNKYSATDLQYLKLLKNLILRTGTKNYSHIELRKEMSIYLGSFYPFIYLIRANDDYYRFFEIDISSLTRNIDYLFSILKEVLFNVIFTDKERIKYLIERHQRSYKDSLIEDEANFAYDRVASSADADCYAMEMLRGISYYNFLTEVVDDIDVKLDDICSKLDRLYHEIFRKDTLIISVLGDSNSLVNIDKKISELGDLLEETFDKDNEFEFVPQRINEGFYGLTDVNTCAQLSIIPNFNSELWAYSLIICNIINNEYLWNKVRILGGAYGCSIYITRYGQIILSSYRDSNIEETYKVYDEIPEFLNNYHPTEEEFDRVIIGVMGNQNAPSTPEDDASSSFEFWLFGSTYEKSKRLKKLIMEAKFEDIKKIFPIIIDALKKRVVCAIGSEDKIKASKVLFDEIKNIAN